MFNATLLGTGTVANDKLVALTVLEGEKTVEVEGVLGLMLGDTLEAA
jgi:hypothetical protein